MDIAIRIPDKSQRRRKRAASSSPVAGKALSTKTPTKRKGALQELVNTLSVECRPALCILHPWVLDGQRNSRKPQESYACTTNSRSFMLSNLDSMRMPGQTCTFEHIRYDPMKFLKSLRHLIEKVKVEKYPEAQEIWFQTEPLQGGECVCFNYRIGFKTRTYGADMDPDGPNTLVYMAFQRVLRIFADPLDRKKEGRVEEEEIISVHWERDTERRLSTEEDLVENMSEEEEENMMQNIRFSLGLPEDAPLPADAVDAAVQAAVVQYQLDQDMRLMQELKEFGPEIKNMEWKKPKIKDPESENGFGFIHFMPQQLVFSEKVLEVFKILLDTRILRGRIFVYNEVIEHSSCIDHFLQNNPDKIDEADLIFKLLETEIYN